MVVVLVVVVLGVFSQQRNTPPPSGSMDYIPFAPLSFESTTSRENRPTSSFSRADVKSSSMVVPPLPLCLSTSSPWLPSPAPPPKCLTTTILEGEALFFDLLQFCWPYCCPVVVVLLLLTTTIATSVAVPPLSSLLAPGITTASFYYSILPLYYNRMQRMEVSSGVLRLPLKNGVSPYNSTVNHQKHLRCNPSSNEMTTKRIPRKASNLMNKTMDNLNYWKRQFNQQEPGMAGAVGLPERLVRVGAKVDNLRMTYPLPEVSGAAGRKAMASSKEESHYHRATTTANQSAAQLISQKPIPKALLKTLSPIQNSPKFLLSSYECMATKKSHHADFALTTTNNNSHARKGQNELDSAPLSDQSSNDLKHWMMMTSDLENDPGKQQQQKKLDYDDDDLVFAIEI
uniref:Uncharacterized protein n=1 Tax=Ditylenchus dipsaci TaxID=166011 RepID=A0A915D3K8_9BILA